jgi:hypothetical protein
VPRTDDLTAHATHRSRPKGDRNHVPAQDLHAALGRGAQAVRQHPLGPPIPTFQGFQVTTHGIWTEHGGNANRLVALISYPNGTDPAELASEVMASPEPKTSLPSTPSPWMRPDAHLSSDRKGPATAQRVCSGCRARAVENSPIRTSQIVGACPPLTRETLLQNTNKAADHRHTDGAHDRHWTVRVVVSLDDESPGNGRHLE